MLHNSYYSKVKVGAVVLIHKKFMFRVKKQDFTIKFKNLENIECQSGNMKLSCLQGKWAVFYALKELEVSPQAFRM